MSIRLNLIVIICTATASLANAQSKEIHGPQVMTETGANSALTPELSDPQLVKALFLELDGTYQINISQPNYQILYSRDLLETIRSSRLLDENAIVEWDAYTTIIIFPKSSSGAMGNN
jgi:hypothetical protein